MLEENEETIRNPNEAYLLIINDLVSKAKELPLKKIIAGAILVSLFFSCGLVYAWMINPVEWDYSNVEVTPSLYNFSEQTQEVTTLGIVNLLFQTQGNEYSKNLVDKSLQELGVTAETLCNVHYRYGAYSNETQVALDQYSVKCVP